MSDRTYCAIVEYICDLSAQINTIYNIQPKVFLRFNQDNEIGGAVVVTYRISDMSIELDIPHNFTFGRKHRTMIACILIHEYCHYIEALTLSARGRVNSVIEYMNNSMSKRAEEQRNWTATKKLTKKLGLWTKSFYNVTRECYYTARLQF